MLALLLTLASFPDTGSVQYGATYRVGIQSLDLGADVTTFASTIEGSARIYESFGVELIAGGVYVRTDDLFADSRWRFGNPLLRVVYADTFDQFRLRASTGVAAGLANDSDDEEQRNVDRSGFASAAARSGGRDLWLWAPRATTWLTTVRIEQPIGIVHLGLDAQALLMVQSKARFGGSLGGDVAVRPLEYLEIGVRVQSAAMVTEGEPLRCFTGPAFGCETPNGGDLVLESDWPNLSFAPWIGGGYDFFHAMARFTVNVTDMLGFEAFGGPYWGFDAAVGVAF